MAKRVGAPDQAFRETTLKALKPHEAGEIHEKSP